MFYEDLSAYACRDGGDVFTDLTDDLSYVAFQPAYERRNIGWLERGRPWRAGPGPDGFTDSLLAVIDAQQVNSTLGLGVDDE